MKSSIKLLQLHCQQMLEDVLDQYPLEACGIVAGQNGGAVAVFPVENSLRSPVRFLMDPAQQVKVLFHLEEQGWDLLAIYHSHPEGPPNPSPTDIAEAYYPEAAYLIWSIDGDDWVCRGYTIVGGSVEEIHLEIIDQE
jgi:[CysO sulfur-carrier protein]-S-L-cysteine hydrolase